MLIGPAALGHLDPTNVAELAVLGAHSAMRSPGSGAGSFRGLAGGSGGRRHADRQQRDPAAGGALIRASLDRQPQRHSLAAIAALGLLSTAIAYLLYFRLLARVGATNLLLVTFLLPIVALAWVPAFLGEHVQPVELLGLR